MRLIKRIIPLAMAVMALGIVLSGCGGKNSSTVESCIISTEKIENQKELDSASQADEAESGKTVYANVHFIESPKGTEYMVRWYLDDKEIKSESKATENDTQDVLIYELQGNKVSKGTLKAEVLYKDTVLFSKELSIK